MSNEHEQGDRSVDQPIHINDTTIALIEEQADKNIRRVFYDGRVFFSVIDVIALLTESPNPRNYWNMLKSRMSEEGAQETYMNCVRLKMRAADGKMRQTDAADTKTLLRIIQSIPSPKAEPVKLWLARIGTEKLQEVTAQPLPPATASQEIAALRRQKPDENAPSLVWADYLERLASLYRRQGQFEAQMLYVDEKLTEHDETLAEHDREIGELHSRMESSEELLRMVPEILERLGPELLSSAHQATVQAMVNRLHELGSFSHAAIHSDLHQAFHVGTYKDIPESHWPEVVAWFQQRIRAAEKQRK
jgi:hypothetical protein